MIEQYPTLQIVPRARHQREYPHAAAGLHHDHAFPTSQLEMVAGTDRSTEPEHSRHHQPSGPARLVLAYDQ
jgi:hypothetical protein